MSLFTNTKEKTPSVNLSSVVYKFSCPGCSFSYIGKTQRTLHERTEEHEYPNKKSNKQNAIYKHLSTCPHYSLKDLLILIFMILAVTKLTLTRLEVTLLFLTKQIIGTNCCLNTLSQYPGGDSLTHRRKKRNFQNFFGVRPSSKFSIPEIRKSTEGTTKPTREDMKTQWGELVNILLWLKNIYIWSTRKLLNDWVTFRCQIILRKIILAMKKSFKV